MGQKGLKLAFLAKNSRFLADFFLNRIGGYPPPLNGESLCSKKLSGQGGTPPPLNGQNPLKRFWQLPLHMQFWKRRAYVRMSRTYHMQIMRILKNVWAYAHNCIIGNLMPTSNQDPLSVQLFEATGRCSSNVLLHFVKSPCLNSVNPLSTLFSTNIQHNCPIL